MRDREEQEECIDRYRAFNACWEVPEGEERLACARETLKLTLPISAEVERCAKGVGSAQDECKHEIQDKVRYMVVFRFYDLEQRAEALIDRGADFAAVVDLETLIEEKKQQFYEVETKEEMHAIIRDVRVAWSDFVYRVKGQVK